jgi:predicted MFS family arabinose efflux permease
VCAGFDRRLADRIGRGRVLNYCLCAFSAANLLTATTGSLTWLIAARWLAGAAAAGVSPSVYALIGSGAPPDRRATHLAIAVSGLLMSLSLGAPIGLLMAQSLGWPIVFAGLGALGLILVWANNRVWRDPGGAGNQATPPRRLPAAAVAARLAPTVLWSTAVYAMYTYLGDGLISLGYSTEEIAGLILLYGCGAISGTLIGGRMADRLGARRTSAIALGGL